MSFRLTPRSMTLDDLELLYVQIFGIVRSISETTTAKRIMIDPSSVSCVDLPYISSLVAFVHALLSRAYLSVS